jgi:hypothetical protein
VRRADNLTNKELKNCQPKVWTMRDA